MPPSLAELRARPDDRELLLVYADWLESQGHPRGELIAVQDAEAGCETVEQFERARARAIELVEGSAELRPEWSTLDSPRRPNAWALWRRGFVRRLELLVDRPTPRTGAGLRGWSELLASLLAHPSLALLEELLIRVDLRGEPLDEAEAALTIVTDGLVGWLAEPDPRPGLLLALWTSRPPRSGQRERYRMSLPGTRKLWYSTDITRFLPPGDSPITELEHAFAASEDERRFDLLWFDSRGAFRDLFEVCSRELGTTAPSLDASLSVHVRHMAERRQAPVLAQHDPLPQRRIVGFIDNLAARFDWPASTHPLAPRRLAARRPEAITLELGCERLDGKRSLMPALARFGDVEWWWVEDRCDDREWLGLIGLGSDQLLALACIE